MVFCRFREASVFKIVFQIARSTSQPALAPRRLASTLSASSFLHRQTNNPILNAARQFHTSPVLCEHPHEHAKIWIMEKATSALMVPLVPLALILQNKILDSILSVLIIAHTFWGLEAIVVEYVRVIVVGPFIPKVAICIVYVLTTIILGGLFYLNFNDIGLSKTFWKIWNNMKKPYVPPPKCPRSAPAV